MKLKKIIFVILLTLFLAPSIKVSADETGSGADFSVSPVYPDKQKDKEIGYFDLELKPKAKETIKVEIRNYSKTENEIFFKTSRATTSDGGVITFKEYKKEAHPKNKTDFNDIAKTREESVKIKPESSAVIEIDITMPEVPIVGEVMGGVHFYKGEELTKEEEKQTVVNRFSYSIPIVLRSSEKKEPNDLILKKVEPGHRNYHNFIEAVIDNQAPARVSKMTIDGRVFKKGEEEAYYVKKEDSYQIAPYSTLNYGFDLNDSQLIPGDYEVVLKINADGQEYELKDEFTITKEDAEKYNEESVFIPDKKSFPWLWVIISIVSITIIGIIITIVVIRNKKKKEKEKRKRNRKKGKSKKRNRK